MVGGDAGETTAVHAETIGDEKPVPVDAVEGEDRQGSGMGAADARAMQLAAEEAPHGAREPLVEIADDDAGPRQILVEDVIADEHAHLVGTLAHLGPECTLNKGSSPSFMTRWSRMPPRGSRLAQERSKVWLP